MKKIPLTEEEIKLIIFNLSQLSVPLEHPDAEKIVICGVNLLKKLKDSILPDD